MLDYIGLISAGRRRAVYVEPLVTN